MSIGPDSSHPTTSLDEPLEAADVETTTLHAPVANPRRVVLVAGSGRSGTSTIAGILREFGVWVPQPEVTADDTNPKGFSEPQWLVDFHAQLLAESGVQVSDSRPSAWFDTGKIGVDEDRRTSAATWLEDQFLESNEVVLKDPRLIWFLGLWQGVALRVGAEVTVVTMLRPPTEVVGSKRAYYGARGEVDTLASWVNLMLHTERATRGANRAFVQYHDLLDDWTGPLARLGERFNLASIKTASAVTINNVHQFVDPSLRRVEIEWSDLDLPDTLRDIAAETWTLLTQLADNEDPNLHSQLDELRQHFSDYYATSEAITYSSVLAERQARRQWHLERRDELKARRDKLKAKVADLKKDKSNLKATNQALRQQVQEQGQRIAELEATINGSTFARLKARVPVPVKGSVNRVLSRTAPEVDDS